MYAHKDVQCTPDLVVTVRDEILIKRERDCKIKRLFQIISNYYYYYYYYYCFSVHLDKKHQQQQKKK